MTFSAEQVGVCLSTLHVDPSRFVAADVERLTRVAADAGFPNLALQIHWVTTYGIDATRRLLDEVGLTTGALEGAVSWAAGPDAAGCDADALLDVASALGAEVLHAACLAPELDLPRAVDGFATLCERARDHDIEVSIEFIPWYAIPDLGTAWEIVRRAEASNGGVCIDLMHWHRQPGGPDFDQLQAIPGERISYVQLTDAPPATAGSPEEYMAECLTLRPVPKEGVIDIDGMLDALAKTGADPCVVYQVCNTSLAGRGADTMAVELRENASMLFG